MHSGAAYTSSCFRASNAMFLNAQYRVTSLQRAQHPELVSRACSAKLCTLHLPPQRAVFCFRQVVCRNAVRAAATQEVEPGKHISSTPIPAFIPREDLIQQLWGWARIECEEAGTISYGLPMKVKPVYRDEGQLWGFTVSILSRDGAVTTEIRVRFDDEIVTKHQWVGRGADGFPSLEGNEEQIMGNELIIRKIDDNPIDDETRTAIRSFCVKLVESVNKYYAFGSCFVDDNT